MQEQALYKAINDLSEDINLNDAVDSIVSLFRNNEITEEYIVNYVKLNNISNKSNVLNVIACKLYENGLYDYIIPLFMESLVYDDNNDDARYNLGYLLFELGQNNLALNYLEKINIKNDYVIELIQSIKSQNIQTSSGKRDYDLIIIDDTFPNLASGFRIAEFNYYLSRFEKCAVYTSVGLFENYIKEYNEYYPDLIGKISPINVQNSFSCSLFYTVFLMNAYNFLPIFERFKTPFVVSLLDGGFLHLNDEESDTKLARICMSPYLKKIITPITEIYDYLISKNFVSKDKIEFIDGGVITQVEYWEKNLVQKKYYKKNKDTFDICFIAYKYSKRGTDKGYDTFVEVAKKLAKYNDDIRFHVVGGFDKYDIDISEINDKITFYGRQPQGFFPEFYSTMDIHLSLMTQKKEKMLHMGRTSGGYCNTTAVQTALNGVAIFGIFEKEKMKGFQDGRDVVLLSEDVDSIVNVVLEYFKDLDSLYNLSYKGQITFSEKFSIVNQLEKRAKILDQFINGGQI